MSKRIGFCAELIAPTTTRTGSMPLQLRLIKFNQPTGIYSGHLKGTTFKRPKYRQQRACDVCTLRESYRPNKRRAMFVQTFQVFQSATLTAGQRLVLGAITTFTDQAGKCWPAIATIAARCALSVRSVQRHIADLLKLGYLQRQYRPGRAAITRVNLDPINPATVSPPPPPPLPNWHPEQAIPEPVTPITAPTVPEPEQPGFAAIVFSEVMDTEPPPVPAPAADHLPVDHLQVTTMQAADDDHLPAPDHLQVDQAMQAELPAVQSGNPLAEVPAELLADFGLVRQARKKSKTVTQTEARVLAVEANKANLSLAEVVKLCVLRGWSRFEAGWMPAPAPQQAPQAPYVHQVAPPASPEVKNAAMARLTELRKLIVSTPKRGHFEAKPQAKINLRNYTDVTGDR